MTSHSQEYLQCRCTTNCNDFTPECEDPVQDTTELTDASLIDVVSYEQSCLTDWSIMPLERDAVHAK